MRRLTWAFVMPLLWVLVPFMAAAPAGTLAPSATDAPLSSLATLTGGTYDAVRAPGGNVWLARGTSVDEVGADGTTLRSIPVTAAGHVAVGPDGRIWFGGTSTFGAIASDGTVTPYTPPGNQPVTSQIVSSGGFVWTVVTQSPGNPLLLKWTTDGTATQYSWPSSSTLFPTDDGVLRFVDNFAAGTVSTDGVRTSSPLPSGVVGHSLVQTSDGTTWITASGGWLVRWNDDGTFDKVIGPITNTTIGETPVVVGPTERLTDGSGWFIGSTNTDDFIGRLGDSGADAVTHLGPVPGNTLTLPLIVESPSGGVWVLDRNSGNTAIWAVAPASTLTSTTLTGPLTPPTYGDTVDLTATVTAWPGVSTPVSGSVDFLTEDDHLIGTVPIVDGVATLTRPTTIPSTRVWARFAGGGGLTGSSSRWSFTTHSVDTTIQFDLPAQPWRPGHPLDIGVNVTGVNGAPVTGTVDAGVLGIFTITNSVEDHHTVKLKAQTIAPYVTYTPNDGNSKPSSLTMDPIPVAWDTPAQNYVNRVYEDLLNRWPDSGGFAYWTAKVDSGTPRSLLGVQLTSTNEYRRVFVRTAYTFVGRTPSSNEMTAALDALANGTTIRRLYANEIGSDEFLHRCADPQPATVLPGSYDCFVRYLYKVVDGRWPTTDEFAAARTYRNNGGTRVGYALRILMSDEGLSSVVRNAYTRYLRRNIDPGGRDYWIREIQAGTREETIVSEILGSDEYYRKAQPA